MIAPNPKNDPLKFTDENEPARLAYTMREVAIAIGVSERSVWSMVASGQLRAIKIGRLVRIPRDAIIELLDGK